MNPNFKKKSYYKIILTDSTFSTEARLCMTFTLSLPDPGDPGTNRIHRNGQSRREVTLVKKKVITIAIKRHLITMRSNLVPRRSLLLVFEQKRGKSLEKKDALIVSPFSN